MRDAGDVRDWPTGRNEVVHPLCLGTGSAPNYYYVALPPVGTRVADFRFPGTVPLPAGTHVRSRASCWRWAMRISE
jgi:hypothetical protein